MQTGMSDLEPLEDGWIEKWSNSKKKHYWYRSDDKKVTTWVRPTRGVAGGAAAAGPSSASAPAASSSSSSSKKRSLDASVADDVLADQCANCSETSGLCPGDPATLDPEWKEKWSKSKGITKTPPRLKKSNDSRYTNCNCGGKRNGRKEPTQRGLAPRFC